MDERNGHVSDKHACFDASKSMHKRTDHSGLCNVSECYETTANNDQDVVAELSSDGTGCRFHTTIDAHDMKSEESELFKKHFGSLSSINKVCTLHVVLIELRLDCVCTSQIGLWCAKAAGHVNSLG